MDNFRVRSATEVPGYVIGRLRYSHGNTGLERLWNRRSDGNLVSILVLGLCHLEHRQNHRRHDEERRIDKVPPRTDPPARAKRQRDRWIIAEGTILVQETLGLECLWLGI